MKLVSELSQLGWRLALHCTTRDLRIYMCSEVHQTLLLGQAAVYPRSHTARVCACMPGHKLHAARWERQKHGTQQAHLGEKHHRAHEPARLLELQEGEQMHALILSLQ